MLSSFQGFVILNSIVNCAVYILPPICYSHLHYSAVQSQKVVSD